MSSTRYSCQILMKLEFSRQIFEKSLNIKFHKNPSSGSLVVPCGQTDMTKLIVDFRNFAKAFKIEYYTVAVCNNASIKTTCTSVIRHTS
jgi:hypothetical protein